jgi:leucyl aminopeptidase
MPATIQFTKTFDKKTDAIIIPIVDGKTPKIKDGVPASVLKHVKALCGQTDGAFDGKHGGTHAFSAHNDTDMVWYVMVGLKKNASTLESEQAGGKLFKTVKSLKVQKAMAVDVLDAGQMAAMANGFYLKSYTFNQYKTKDASDKIITLKCVVQDKAKADKAFAPMKAISDAVFKARDFVTTPPNDLYPESYVKMMKAFFKGTSVKMTVLDEKKLEKMGAGALMAVGKASVNQPRLVVLEYDGRTKKNKADKPLAMVGKGVTYDTGGYSLKPPKSMETMKMDMGGSAAVVGVMHALATNKADTHVVAAVALAENMIAGNGYRVDDVLTSLSGQTIEVLNTDAEGRLCMADALTHIQDTFDPRAIIDIATLTGACMAALGLDMAGVFTNSDSMTKSFVENGKTTGDDFWSLPLNDAFDKQLESPIADMRNLGTVPFAGASTAAAFLQRFITNDRPWAHLDIAGTAWRQSENDLTDKGASGFGVRALYHWATTYK